MEGGKEYYMNILAKNKNTGEVITYKPVKIVASSASRRLKAFIIIFLVVIFIVFLYMAFTVYRKYRFKKIELNYVEDQNMLSPRNQNRKIGKLKNINLDFVKKKPVFPRTSSSNISPLYHIKSHPLRMASMIGLVNCSLLPYLSL